MHHIDASLWTVCTVMAYALSDVDGNRLFHHKNRRGGLAWKMHIEEGAGFPGRAVTVLHYPGISRNGKKQQGEKNVKVSSRCIGYDQGGRGKVR